MHQNQTKCHSLFLVSVALPKSCGCQLLS